MSKREFTGVFIPAHIWESKELIPAEKMMLGEIDALSKKTGYCNASRSHFAEWLCCTVQNISYYFSKLESLGFISIEKQSGQRSKIRLVSDRFYAIETDTRKPDLPVNGTDGGGKRDLPEIKDKYNNEIKDEIKTAEENSALVKVEIFEMKTDFVEAPKNEKFSTGAAKKNAEYTPRDVARNLEISEQVFFTAVIENGSWPDYLEYRKTKDRFKYKDPKSHALAIKNLFSLTGGIPENAQTIIDQSRANGWTGLFPIKDSKNGTNGTKPAHVQNQHDLAAFVLSNRKYPNPFGDNG